MFRLRTISRTRFVLAIFAVFAAGAALLWGLSNLNIDLSAPLTLGYRGGQGLAVWWVISVPLIWLCRARARAVGVKPGRVLIVWAISSALHVLVLATLWHMGRSWLYASDAVVTTIFSMKLLALVMLVGLLCWLTLKRHVAVTP